MVVANKTCFSTAMKSIEAHEIVHGVLEVFRGLPSRLASITGKSASWYQSHGRTPKTFDPVANGNVSPVTHYMRYARKFEMAEPGSGRMLNNRVHAELDSEFAQMDLHEVPQRNLEVDVIDQTCDVQKWLARFDIENASRNDLLGFEKECDQALDAIAAAKARARVQLKEIEMERSRTVARIR